jgi:hypothetical protein
MILTFVSTMDIQWTSKGGRTTLPCRPDRCQIPGTDDIQLDVADGEDELPALGRKANGDAAQGNRSDLQS